MYYYHQQAQHRMELRDMRGISGGTCTDWLTHCCCPCCAVCQEAHEVNSKVPSDPSQTPLYEPV